jgi:hypothetical protein
VIVAFDFFTVPTLTFQLLYCFFVIEHGRRRVLHFNVTGHPAAEWVVQQLREAYSTNGGRAYAPCGLTNTKFYLGGRANHAEPEELLRVPGDTR